MLLKNQINHNRELTSNGQYAGINTLLQISTIYRQSQIEIVQFSFDEDNVFLQQFVHTFVFWPFFLTNTDFLLRFYKQKIPSLLDRMQIHQDSLNLP